MKKIAPIVALALLASFASCKKEYTCECKTTTNGVTTTASGKSEKMKKKDAEEKCNQGDGEVTVMGITSKTDCEVK